MAAERLADRLPSLRVPQSRGVIVRCGDDARAIRAKCCAQHRMFMPPEGLADWLAGLSIPQPRGFVGGRRDDAIAVATEGRAPHNTPMPPKHHPLAQRTRGAVQANLSI